MRDLNEIKKELEKRLAHSKAGLKAWSNVKRVTKKDSSDFANLAKNFEGATIRGNKYSLHSGEKNICVFFRDESGAWFKDEIHNQSTRTEGIDPSRIIKESYLTPYYQLTVNEIFEAIEHKKTYYAENIEKYTRELQTIDAAFATINEQLTALKATLAGFERESASCLKEYIKKNLGY